MQLKGLLTFTYLLIQMGSAFCHANVDSEDTTAPTKPLSEGGSTIAIQKPTLDTELVFHIGNESNPVDGIFGPFTYGPRASHKFENGIEVEAGYIRLHEPQTSLGESLLDEAQFTVRFPELKFLEQDLIIGATAWQNRMIDLYTNLFGLEVTSTADTSITLGAYLGTATRDDESGRFVGGQLSLAHSFGRAQITGACLAGQMSKGTYRKIALGASTEIASERRLPINFSLSIEDRYFSFGTGGSTSEPRDEFIFVSGIELHFEKMF